MNFEHEFHSWLAQSLTPKLSNEIKAFSFNLCEFPQGDGMKFAVELIGAGEFDLTDSDWACDEVWEPEQRQLNIPVAFSGDSWEACLENIKQLISDTLQSEHAYVAKLKKSKGIGVGFVDGDLEVIWQP